MMCVVPPKSRVEIMAHAYSAAIKTVGDGDRVYLLDRYAGGPVRPFNVKAVEIA